MSPAKDVACSDLFAYMAFVFVYFRAFFGVSRLESIRSSIWGEWHYFSRFESMAVSQTSEARHSEHRFIALRFWPCAVIGLCGKPSQLRIPSVHRPDESVEPLKLITSQGRSNLPICIGVKPRRKTIHIAQKWAGC